MRVILAIPSKGRLQEQAFAYLADCGLSVSQDGGARSYSAAIAAAPDIEVRLLSASDIARALTEGEAHLGVTGEDVVREAAFDAPRAPVSVRPLGFGRADLVVAAPASWLDVSTMADLAEVCAEHRARTGRRLRVATKYIHQTRLFFESRGVEDWRLVESLGATEGAPAAGAAEVIVDITSTGATLAANQLKILDDGLILKSEAHLFAAPAAAWRADGLSAAQRLIAVLEARARGKKMRLLRATAPNGGIPDTVRKELQRLGCREDGAYPEGGSAVVYLCPRDQVFQAVDRLRLCGAAPVRVSAADYLFEGEEEAAIRLARVLAAS